MPPMLTDLTIRKAKANGKTQRLFDAGGLYLEISPNGGKWWRLKFRHGGKEKRLSLGTYPEVSLVEARDKRAEHKKLLSAGVDPGQHRKAATAAGAERAANSFEVVAREWFAKQQVGWAPSHADKVIARLENDILPWLGSRPVAEITAPELLKHLDRIEKRGAVETAHRALQNCGQIFRYAIQTGRAERDPTYDLKGALTPHRTQQYAHVVEPAEIAVQLRKIHACKGTFPVLCALRLVPLLFARTGELRHMRWTDLDLEAGQWCYTVSKTRRQHIASLSSQAVAILTELKPLTGHHQYVFPGKGRDRKEPISSNAILQALRRAGISKEEQTIHGYRHTASVRLNEMSTWNTDAIEAALTHKMPGVRGVYAGRAQYLDERRRMMQAWADYLDALRTGTNVIPIKREVA
ncbi:integrase [Pseudoxanthomonas broegbernensis]|uniref:Integrase n=2 Tax=Pseudoxanthomonas broegbernensis TaxID=83619 RepID=A0A7V8GPY0_9GAMM|nr:integrase arm-type DNA-binding domain-containing protein [Pseudoxanthomonas broegbernensis]KAF1687958.1 integrase [Pseudoxanthomonas broegbernensis]